MIDGAVVAGSFTRDGRARGCRARALGYVACALACALPAGCAAWQEPALDSPAKAAAFDDRELAALVPAGVETVIEVDLSALRRSPWTADALPMADARLRDRKAAALGYDGTTDVDRIIYAVGAAGSDAPTLVIAEGRLLTANVEAAFRERWPTAVVDSWRGRPILTSGENAMASLSARTFASGSPDKVRAVVDRAFGVGADFRDDGALGGAAFGGATNSATPAVGRGAVRRDLLGLVGRPPPAVLGTVALGEKIRARVGELFPLPRALRQVGLRLDVGETLDVQVLGVLDDRGAAEDLARRLRVLFGDRDTRRALADLGLADLLEGGKAVSDGAEVRVRLSVAPEHRTRIAAALRTIVEALRTGADPRGGASW